MALSLPDYVLEQSQFAIFTRLQRVGLHLALLQDEAMEEIDLSFSDYSVLATLRREGPPHHLSVSRLAELILAPMGSITQIVDRLIEGGLVDRHADTADRRRVLIGLTPDGLDLANRGDKAYGTVRQRIIDRLDTNTLTDLDKAVATLLGALENDHVEMTT